MERGYPTDSYDGMTYLLLGNVNPDVRPQKFPDLSQGLAGVGEAPLCPVLPPLEAFVCGP